MKIASIKYRIFAYIADTIVNAIVIILILLFTSSSSLISILSGGTSVINIFILLKLIQVGMLITTYLVVYSVIIPLYTKGQTLGYFLFKIRVVQEDGSNVTFMNMFIREMLGRLALTLTTMGLGFIVSFIIMLYRKDNCGIHDILGKTKVVDKITEEQ
ncbi:MAG: RDD family protein [Erysipelotrichales bacterium]|nr:RDD family protein [Erysipelotrichales bacterium]